MNFVEKSIYKLQKWKYMSSFKSRFCKKKSMICVIPPTSVKCSTVGWWHSNSIFSEARSPVFNLALKSPPLKNLKDSSAASLKTFRVFHSRHLSLWITADQPDCRSTHISGVFSSSPSTLSSGKIQNHICPAISPSFAFLPLLIYFPGPSSCTFIFSRSLFVYIAIFQVPLLVRCYFPGHSSCTLRQKLW